MEIMTINSPMVKDFTTVKTYSHELSSDLLIDGDYQRPLSEKRVREICDDFNDNVINLIKVSQRDGKFYVFDGQHTKAALERLNGDMPLMVEVMIYEFVGLTSAEQKQVEAELFAIQDGIFRSVESTPRFRALLGANDPGVTQFHSVTNSAGVLMDFTNGRQDRKLVCFKEAWSAWNTLGNSLYADMLKVILEAWGGDKTSFQSQIIGGLSRFIKAYHDKYDRSILIDCLSAVSPAHIISEGLKTFESSKFKYMRIILRLYNKEVKRRQKAVC
jgi:hypothetical protein